MVCARLLEAFGKSVKRKQAVSGLNAQENNTACEVDVSSEYTQMCAENSEHFLHNKNGPSVRVNPGKRAATKDKELYASHCRFMNGRLVCAAHSSFVGERVIG